MDKPARSEAAPEQLSLDEARWETIPSPSPGEDGYLLLELLDLDGWSVHVRRAFAGEGVALIAARGSLTVAMQGPSVADAAPFLVIECARYRRFYDGP